MGPEISGLNPEEGPDQAGHNLVDLPKEGHYQLKCQSPVRIMENITSCLNGESQGG